MKNTWTAALQQAAVRTFEELCFLLPEDESTSPVTSELDVAARVTFQGPLQGTLEVQLSHTLLPLLATNMLGEEDPPPIEQQYDALQEVANVICGNVLPQLAGVDKVFQLRPPQVTRAMTSLGDLGVPAAEVCMHLEQEVVIIRLFVDNFTPREERDA